MASALVKAIRGEGKIEYMGEDNPIQTQFLRVSDMHEVCRFLSEAAMCDYIPAGSTYAVGVIFGMVGDELKDIAEKLDEANVEVCATINEKRH